MAHNHGYEYQIRIARKDGTEELSGWMNSTEQVAQAMIVFHKPQLAGFWHETLSVPTAQTGNRFWNIPSPRCIPHDSRYLQVVESRNRFDLGLQYRQH
jgi:hypothetical protein